MFYKAQKIQLVMSNHNAYIYPTAIAIFVHKILEVNIIEIACIESISYKKKLPSAHFCTNSFLQM